MKDYGFKIKVSDLLLNIGSEDKIKFENKFVDSIDNLTEDGIEGIVNLEGLDHKTVRVRLEKLKCNLQEICELSGEKFLLEINVSDFEMNFLALDLQEIIENYGDEFGQIDIKNLTIDISDMIYQAIQLNKPISIRSEKYSKINDIKNEDYTSNLNTINWIYKNK
ncbi:hypothetical protein [Candidatus Vampirococcus lugosii]|uniref:Uncharacterized protein n=1 Tax=Candidatus Vampirococcus lugosii TaxID=2789015 RepID=A0ABS5QKI7_9BACT|nr:hypothetical protein [Candidatus Vampirococcus lugosii]MBS8121753.1 hypothetical protein [Candidatus Vampirococcus lugosii]